MINQAEKIPSRISKPLITQSPRELNNSPSMKFHHNLLTEEVDKQEEEKQRKQEKDDQEEEQMRQS